VIFPQRSGILVHVTSLPGGHGIGDLGESAHEFIDFLAGSGQKIWQVLPLNPTGYGDSPYQCFSAFAGNPLFIVLLLDNYDHELVVNSLRAGARGLFCLASMPFKSLCRCITSVHQGQYWTNTEQMSYLIDALSIAPSIHLINSRGRVVLTPREEQTVQLVTEGLNNREIARELNLKENTVKKSLLRIYDKLGVSNRVELVLYALSHSQERLPGTERLEQPA